MKKIYKIAILLIITIIMTLIIKKFIKIYEIDENYQNYDNCSDITITPSNFFRKISIQFFSIKNPTIH